VADQLWLMTRIREEEEVPDFGAIEILLLVLVLVVIEQWRRHKETDAVGTSRIV